ncbi:hypothetical protein [Halobacteriovorax sp. JY17]|uniref:hypothetical protein n=1 Tax=Halobacteriovorax sp. JY17 TaxID=2014617 RepID=UPI0025BF9177|nr:hypothetical protein [Halobacteriovorax sp. JY17]
MRVFTTFNETLPAATEKPSKQRGKKSGPTKVDKSYRPPRENLSPEEIKARVAKKTGHSAEKKVENLAGKQVSTFMADTPAVKTDIRTKAATTSAVKGLGNPEEVEKKANTPEAKKVLLHSDVDKNDPKDTNVQEKLKGLLGSGGFGWNEKERAALSEILGKS